MWSIFDAMIFGAIALVIDIALVYHEAPTQLYIIPIIVLISGLAYAKGRN